MTYRICALRAGSRPYGRAILEGDLRLRAEAHGFPGTCTLCRPARPPSPNRSSDPAKWWEGVDSHHRHGAFQTPALLLSYRPMVPYQAREPAFVVVAPDGFQPSWYAPVHSGRLEIQRPPTPDVRIARGYPAGSHDERLFPGVPDSYTVPIRAHEERRQRSARRPSAENAPALVRTPERGCLMHGGANPHGSRGSGRAEWALAAVPTGPMGPDSARQGPNRRFQGARDPSQGLSDSVFKVLRAV